MIYKDALVKKLYELIDNINKFDGIIEGVHIYYTNDVKDAMIYGKQLKEV